ncbi:MAG: hypothetical protein ACRDH5_11705 [bacterium]
MAYRDEVDWRRLLEEGGTIPLNGLTQVTALVASLDEKQDVVVVLVPCLRTTTERLRANLGTYLGIVKGLVPLLTGR